MFRLIFLVQAVIYLLLVPYYRRGADPFFDPPFLIGVTAILGFVSGLVVFQAARPNTPASLAARTPSRQVIVPQRWLPIAVLGLAALYAYVSLTAGLTNRRLGSEYMAEVFGSLPLWQLAVIRGYEILLVPILVLFFFNDKKVTVPDKLMIAGAVLISVPFMGLQDSRGRILLIALTTLTFLPQAALLRTAFRSTKFQFVAATAVAVFGFVSMQRSSRYGSFADFVYYELIYRLDGLNVVAALRDAGVLRPWGTFDTGMLAPLVSRLPFLDIAREAKLAGITSTKQYLLRFVLLRSEIDTPNSMVTDPIYFAGYPGLFLVFALLGYAGFAFDRRINDRNLFSSPLTAATLLAFGSSFVILEADLFGTPTTFLLMFVFCLALTFFCTRWVDRSEEHKVPLAAGPALPSEGAAISDRKPPALR